MLCVVLSLRFQDRFTRDCFSFTARLGLLWLRGSVSITALFWELHRIVLKGSPDDLEFAGSVSITVLFFWISGVTVSINVFVFLEIDLNKCSNRNLTASI